MLQFTHICNILCAGIVLLLFVLAQQGHTIYVDRGYPYSDGPLKVGSLTLSKTVDNIPKHTKVYYPLAAGDYAVIYYIGGLNSLVLAEYYSIYLQKVASHGFYVFGIDYDFPALSAGPGLGNDVGMNIGPYFDTLAFLQTHMVNRTAGTPRWERTGLLCHSAGCDWTLKMMLARRFNFTASVFLEPVSFVVLDPVPYTIPALMYGTQLAEEGLFKCNIKAIDYNRFYDIWRCPRIVVKVADFGHCDILDPIPWEGCHLSHFCKTTNDSRLTEYRQFAQGATASFFITQLQGRPDAVSYITDPAKSPLKLLEDKSDLKC